MRLFSIIILFFLFSCQSSVPKNIIAPKKMQAVLWDMMQADEIAEYPLNDSSFLNLSKHVDYYQKVLAIHKISREDFKRSLTYYENHPGTFKNILDSLQSYGERLQHADSAKQPATPHKTDSLLRKKPAVIMRP
jgi:Domain of unknown function (DUF4296)